MELVVELDNEKYLCARSYTKSQIEGKDEWKPCYFEYFFIVGIIKIHIKFYHFSSLP